MAMWQILQWEGPEHSWQSRLVPVALGLQWALTGTDSDSGLGFAYPVADANAQSIMNK